jgi:hypothetical protein
VPLCNEEGVIGLDQDADDGVSCVIQSVVPVGGGDAILHSTLYVNEFDPPKGKH